MTRASNPEQTGTGGRSTRGRDKEQRAEQAHTEQEHTERTQQDGNGPRATRSATLRLPFLTAQFEVPRGSGGRPHIGPVSLPSPTKTAYYVGLGALAAVEVVEWPIVAAIAAGTYVAQHTRAQERALPELAHTRGDAHTRGEGTRNEQREPAAASA